MLGLEQAIVPRPEMLSWITSLEVEAAKSSSVIYQERKNPTFDINHVHMLAVKHKRIDSGMLYGLRFCDLEVPTVFFAFRGTSQLMDWISNFKFDPGKPFEPEYNPAFEDIGDIHTGFWNELGQNLDTIGDHLGKLVDKHQLRAKEWALVLTGLGSEVQALQVKRRR